MVEYIYTVLDENNVAYVAVQGKSLKVLKNFMERQGLTGVATCGGKIPGIKVSEKQRMGYICGRDRTLENGNQYVKIGYIRTVVNV